MSLDSFLVDETSQVIVNTNCVTIDHFTVVCFMTWPLNGSEVAVDLVLIKTSLPLLCKSSCSFANIYMRKAERCVSKKGLFQPRLY